MFDYEVKFIFESFYIGTSVYAETDELAEQYANEKLREETEFEINEFGKYQTIIEIMGEIL
jgi:hypothetical protein